MSERALKWIILGPAWMIVLFVGTVIVLPQSSPLGIVLGLYALGATSAAFSIAITQRVSTSKENHPAP